MIPYHVFRDITSYVTSEWCCYDIPKNMVSHHRIIIKLFKRETKLREPKWIKEKNWRTKILI